MKKIMAVVMLSMISANMIAAEKTLLNVTLSEISEVVGEYASSEIHLDWAQKRAGNRAHVISVTYENSAGENCRGNVYLQNEIRFKEVSCR